MRKEEAMLNEDAVAEIITNAEAIRTIIDDISDNLPLKEQYRQQAIYILAEHIVANCTAEK